MYGCLHSPETPPAADLLALAREFTPRVEAPDPLTVLLDCRGRGRVWRRLYSNCVDIRKRNFTSACWPASMSCSGSLWPRSASRQRQAAC